MTIPSIKNINGFAADLIEPTKDTRPESRKIKNATENSLQTIGEPISPKNQWAERRKHFIDKVCTYDNMAKLIGLAHANKLSLALFKPTEWKGFTCEEVEREWDANKIRNLEVKKRQHDFFKDQKTVAEELRVVKKLPYKFSYRFADNEGKESKLMIEDWEIGALYWNCLRRGKDDEAVAVEKVRQKYWNEFIDSGKLSPLLILGTTNRYHKMKAPNPFVIIGVIPLPVIAQGNTSQLFSLC